MRLNRCLHCLDHKLNVGVCPHCGVDDRQLVPAANAMPAGTILRGRYLVGRVLGVGGFGITYLALELNSQQKVAIKEYMPTNLASRRLHDTAVYVFSGESTGHYRVGLTKFLEEAQTLARFRTHPNIVAVRDFFHENNSAYIVMEFLEGVTLREYVRRKGGKLSVEEAVVLLMPVMDALKAVHQEGLLHRDISPENIYLTSRGFVKLLDFGAARHAMGAVSQNLSVILKPGYAPEEQYRATGKQGAWTDVYALAATLYFMLSGRVPQDSLDRLDRDEMQTLSELGVKLPDTLEAVLCKALSVRAADRFDSMEAFQTATLQHETVGAKLGKPSFRNYAAEWSGSAKRPKKRWLVWSTILLAIACTIGSLWWFMLDDDRGVIRASDVVQNDGWLYYFYFENEDKFGLVKSRSDGSERKYLVEKSVGNYLMVVDDWLYYNRIEDGETEMMRVPLNGGEPQSLSETGCRMNAFEKQLYYCMGGYDADGPLMTAKLDGTDEREMTSDAFDAVNVAMNRKYLFVSYGEEGVYRLKHDGSDQKRIFDKESYGMFYDDGFLYVLVDRDDEKAQIYRLKEDGSNVKMLADDDVSLLDVENGWVYYERDELIYRMKSDGSEQTFVSDVREGILYSLTVIGERIYYFYSEDGVFGFFRMGLDGSGKTRM